MKQKSRKSKTAGRRRKSSAISRLFYIVFGGALAAALFFTFSFGGAGSQPAPEVIPGGALTVSNDFHDFGRISMRDGKVSRLFHLKNTSLEPALIRKLYTS